MSEPRDYDRPSEPIEAEDEADGVFDPEGPGQHDHHLLDDDDEQSNDYVDCPKCGERILAFAERCPACGHYFEAGEAWQAATEEAGFPRWLGAVALLALVAFVLWLVTR
jgi:DNA-directed RNA polymerase subunit RPC12/RpoP